MNRIRIRKEDRSQESGVRRNLGLLLLLPLASVVVAQQPVVQSTAEEVVLDVVVRDKRGKQIRDLGPNDFEVADNGVKQTIKSVRLVEGKEAISKGATAALDPFRQIR